MARLPDVAAGFHRLAKPVASSRLSNVVASALALGAASLCLMAAVAAKAASLPF